jgi:hypothetical protein
VGWGIHSTKSKNYEDFKKAALLMRNKAHLTREGLEEIKKIKGTMKSLAPLQFCILSGSAG